MKKRGENQRFVNCNFLKKNRKAQVWVETVIYTLIALTIIGLFLSLAKPKIEEIQDKAIIEQSIEMLEDINNIILSIVQGGAANQRVIELGIKKGSLKIDGKKDQLVFELEGRYTYTEPGENGQPGEYINIGNIIASTRKRGKLSKVTLISNYSDIYNITYRGSDEIKVISKSSAAYKISISNKGESDGKNIIDIIII